MRDGATRLQRALLQATADYAQAVTTFTLLDAQMRSALMKYTRYMKVTNQLYTDRKAARARIYSVHRRMLALQTALLSDVALSYEVPEDVRYPRSA